MNQNTSQAWMFVACAATFATFSVWNVEASAADIIVPNGSFEDVNTLAVGGVWPEADADPINADFWHEPGPVNDDFSAFPPNLIPPGFDPPEGATLDTGVFFNVPAFQDPSTGETVLNDSFVTNADGNQLAYLFAKDDLDPPISFTQYLSQVFQPGFEYTLTSGVGKSFFLPPIGGSQGDPSAALRLVYRNDSGDMHTVAETAVAVSQVENTTLRDFSTRMSVDLTDPWQGREIGIAFAPVDGASGAWILDHVRLTVVPEPTTLVIIGLIVFVHWSRRRAQ